MALSPDSQQTVNNASQQYLQGKLEWDSAAAVVNRAVERDIASGYLSPVGDGSYTSPDGTKYFMNTTTGAWDSDVGVTGGNSVNTNSNTVSSQEVTAVAPATTDNKTKEQQSATSDYPATTSGYGEENDPPQDQKTIQAGEDADFEKAWADSQAEVNNLTPAQQKRVDEEFDKAWEQSNNEYKITPASDSRKAVDQQRNKQPDPPPAFKQAEDWRVRLSLAPSAHYLYNVATPNDILFPLKETKGVVFPYTPVIQTAYRASYSPSEMPHTNYKNYFYQNSSMDDIQITAEFTAQDTFEAKYLLAVMHFFKSATKMFYGQDKSPRAGTPPPLLYLSGYGKWQFDNHPLLVTGFQLNLPNDVDYVRTSTNVVYSQGKAADDTFSKNTSMRGIDFILDRLKGSKLSRGGGTKNVGQFNYLSNNEATYVPTKIQLALTLLPVVTRKDISDNFSLTDYATGSLLRGSKRGSGGIW